ncbi:hypothetical protein TrRE_jg3473 [Triparma retinervis]|uniref:Uncharacterized protein n=1 Tax=Triparma retinervis TaxID=2557542 RepID=A0A9W7A9Z0_9STRA|nr:hypothetical protein TrRE_jg3473 [Triparma retinervis]
MISECRPELGVHALIKLKIKDKRGSCLGQGVVSFGEFMTRVTNGETCSFTATVDMGIRGKKLGVLQCTFDIVELWEMQSLSSEDAENVV